jgi:F-type H+-transporting ATPase subunit delta
MENRALAHRYAKALLKLDPTGSVESDVELLHESLHRSRHTIMVFLDPMVLGSVKLAAVRKAFGPMNQKLSDFLDFLQQKNRVDHLPLILAVYLSLRRKERGLLKGHIHSAIPLTPEQIHSIELALGKKLEKHCEFQDSVDSRLIGGFTVQIEDTVYDCSVRTQLDGVRSRFLNLAG